MAPPRGEELTSFDLLGLRVSASINSAAAQLSRMVLIHRLETDTDQDWNALKDLLAETDGLRMSLCDEGSMLLQWDMQTEEDRAIEEAVELRVVCQRQGAVC
ncbi:DUF1654 domain-containing protein [Pseudomonas peradeniyensis]|uniref:DUF1654 domain-containing protein n=1 Tax=Pseudomonas peradeniyensis TaxID=2745488 RepID=A0ABT2VFS7_9PSED|nr:DUF1654 domain-containing protein [Pseudomonas peradeniyensis]MCU7240382.1 DUF1654 domain-containing protein [Pseudomonas peradeniyensis]